MFDIKLFAPSEYNEYTLEPRVYISEEEFESLANNLGNVVEREKIGLDDLTIKKLLLIYYRSVYTANTKILIELTPDEFSNKSDLKPFDKEYAKKTEDSESLPYLYTVGVIEFKKNNKEMYCYTKEGLNLMYDEYINENGSDRGQAIENFLKKCYTINSDNNTIQMYAFSKETIESKYTLESNGKTYEGEKITGKANYVTLDYKTNISNLVTPIEFLVQLMEITGSNEFMQEVIKLAERKTKIELGIKELTNVNEENTSISYTQNNSITGKAEDGTSKTVMGEEDTVNVEIIKTNEESKYDIVVESASTWYASLEASNNPESVKTTYKKDKEGNLIEISDDEENEVEELDSADETNKITVQGEAKDNYIYEDPESGEEEYIQNIFKKTNEDKSYDYYEMELKKTNVKTKTIISTSIDKIVLGTETFVDEHQDFLSLLKDDSGEPIEYKDIYGGKSKVGDLLINSAEMLFELLDTSHTVVDESNNTERKICNTVGLSDVMRYILYKYSDINYGVTELGRQIFGNLSTRRGRNNQLKRYIRYFENAGGAPTNADGTKYIIESDGFGNLTAGYGVDIYNGGFANEFLAAGYTIALGAEVDVEFVDALEEREMNSAKESILNSLDGIDLTDYQINALISRAYNCGIAGALDKYRNGRNFKQAYLAFWNQERDDLFEEKINTLDDTHQLYTTYMSMPVTADGTYVQGLKTRRDSEWKLFQTGYYDVLGEWHTEKGDLMESAKMLHEMQYGFTWGGIHNGDIEAYLYDNPGISCCASYVAGVLYLSGYYTEEEINTCDSNYGKGTGCFNVCSGIISLLESKGYQRITDKSKIEVGDIVFTSNEGHVQIYAGDNLWYSHGSDRGISSDGPYAAGFPGGYSCHYSLQ